MSNRPSILGIDLDGVLADFVSGYRLKCLDLVGRPLPKVPTCWDFPQSCGYTDAEVIAVWEWIYQHPEWWGTLAPLAGPLLLPDDADVYFITNRPLRPGVKAVTERWLAYWYRVPHPTVVMTKRKGEAANALHLTRFIDDKPANLREVRLARSKTRLTLCRRPWNQAEQHLWATVAGVEEWLE